MYPRLRENVWRIDPHKSSAVLMTPARTYTVPTMPALEFLKMRSYCTGHHPVGTIAEKSGLSVDEVNALLASLAPAGVILPSDPGDERLTVDELGDRFTKVAALWSAELRIMYIGNEFARGELPKTALAGWLLEMYHYIHDFPDAIEHAARHATGELHDVLANYARQERGHELFVLDTLQNLGISRAEAESSTPLLATRLIGFLMRELFELAPWAVLPVAAMIEAQEFDEPQIATFKAHLCARYGLSADAFDPYFAHQEIDVGMGHAELLATHRQLIEVTDRKTLDQVTNKIHDLLHAFDLQGLEIKAYYAQLDGKYVPRQPVTFDSI
jgi:pyrroloquinoline quinone (PQQ) biosynthesis protein C